MVGGIKLTKKQRKESEEYTERPEWSWLRR